MNGIHIGQCAFCHKFVIPAMMKETKRVVIDLFTGIEEEVVTFLCLECGGEGPTLLIQSSDLIYRPQ